MELYLLGMRDGRPTWTDSAANAASWFTEAAAQQIARLLPCPDRMRLVPITYIREARDPLGWRCSDG